GFPHEEITIKAHSSYEGTISVKFNLNQLTQLNVIEELKKDRAAYLEVSASGRYGFGLFVFNTIYSNKFSFALPIEGIKLSFTENQSLGITSIQSSNNYLTIKLAASLDYNGTISLNQTQISGYALNNNIKVFTFNSSIPKLVPGKNIILLEMFIPDNNVKQLLFNDLKLKIFYQIESGAFFISDSIDYLWEHPLNLSINNFEFNYLNSNNINLVATITLNNYINYDFNITAQLKIFDNSNNIILKSLNFSYIIKGLTNNQIDLEMTLSNVYHGMVLRCELYLLSPFKLDTPIAVETFIMP
ncbi:MAG TPA: hypothetical protein VKU94_05800, partial [Geobacterales bacterium]|nr:hypothetical protein [Geobacterales bacterium]